MKLPKYAAAATAAVVLTSVAGVTAVSAAQGNGEHKAAPSSNAAALPSVNMEAVVKAAQIDPRRADSTLTPGAKASVLLVEKALADKHFLDKKWVDGYFGTTTTAAYTKYQKSLGYKGLSANGLPGKTSLAKLGAGRFTLNHTIVPGAKVRWGKYTVNARTQKMMLQAQKLLNRKLVLDQGSYSPGADPTSAGTHDGGGVIDVNVKGMSAATRTKVAKALRQVGFAAWVRNPSQGNWPWHIHATAINDTDLSIQAQHQIGDYYLGQNGLANRGKDDGPKVPIRTWEEYLRLR